MPGPSQAAAAPLIPGEEDQRMSVKVNMTAPRRVPSVDQIRLGNREATNASRFFVCGTAIVAGDHGS
jgi:hypothetical protein